MLWLSQNYYDNYVCVILMKLSLKIWDAVALQKIIILIETLLTSNNFIDAHKWPQEYNKPIPKWG
jgi:hypothetical protein